MKQRSKKSALLLEFLILLISIKVFANESHDSKIKFLRVSLAEIEIENGELWKSNILDSEAGGYFSFEENTERPEDSIFRLTITITSQNEAIAAINSINEFSIRGKILSGFAYELEFTIKDVANFKQSVKPCGINSKVENSELHLLFEIKDKRGYSQATLDVSFYESREENEILKKIFLDAVNSCLRFTNSRIPADIKDDL